MSNPKQHPLTQVLFSLFGQQSTLVIHKPILKALNGDHATALFLEQLIYWQTRSQNEGKWVVKSFEEWYDEIMLTRRQIKRSIEILKAWGLETQMKRSAYHRGGATLHYRINLELFQQKLTTEQNVNITKGSEDILTKGSEDILTKSAEVIIDYAETTKTTDAPAIASAPPTVKKKEKAPRPRNLHFDAIVSAFGYSTVTKSQGSLIGSVAKELADAGVTPEQIATIYAYCKAKFENFSAKALATHAGDALKAPPTQQKRMRA